jgi:hypothetical protein
MILTVYEGAIEKNKGVYKDLLDVLGYTFKLSVDPLDFRVFDGDKELPREDYDVWGFKGYKFKGTRGESIYFSGDSKLEIYIPGKEQLAISAQYFTYNFSKNISINYWDTERKTEDSIDFYFNDFRPSSPRRIVTEVEKYTTHYELESKKSFVIEQYHNKARCYNGPEVFVDADLKETPKDISLDANAYMSKILEFVRDNTYINKERMEQGLRLISGVMMKRLDDFEDETIAEAEFKVRLANSEKEGLIRKREDAIARINKLITKKDKEIAELTLSRNRIKGELTDENVLELANMVLEGNLKLSLLTDEELERITEVFENWSYEYSFGTPTSSKEIRAKDCLDRLVQLKKEKRKRGRQR